MPTGSEPALGSVSPKQPTSSPVASRGKKRSFCSSDPNKLIGCMTSDDCTDSMERYPESTRSTSLATRP